MEPRPRTEPDRPEDDEADPLDDRESELLPRETEEDRERAADDGWPDPSEQAE